MSENTLTNFGRGNDTVGPTCMCVGQKEGLLETRGGVCEVTKGTGSVRGDGGDT